MIECLHFCRIVANSRINSALAHLILSMKDLPLSLERIAKLLYVNIILTLPLSDQPTFAKNACVKVGPQAVLTWTSLPGGTLI